MLPTGLSGEVIITSASHATGVKFRPASCTRPEKPGRALAAMSALPLSAASMPERVLNGCTSMRLPPLAS